MSIFLPSNALCELLKEHGQQEAISCEFCCFLWLKATESDRSDELKGLSDHPPFKFPLPDKLLDLGTFNIELGHGGARATGFRFAGQIPEDA